MVAREGGCCFYCLQQISGGKRCIDPVMPQALREFNSYRNLVSYCVECNSWPPRFSQVRTRHYALNQ